jgi:hypothetical protein
MVYLFGGVVVKDGAPTNELLWMTSERMEWHLQPTRGDKPCPRYGHVTVRRGGEGGSHGVGGVGGGSAWCGVGRALCGEGRVGPAVEWVHAGKGWVHPLRVGWGKAGL